MDQLARGMSGYPWGGFSAIMVTVLLFTALPLLTHMQPGNRDTDSPQFVFISAHKPPPPPPEDRDHPEIQNIIEKKFPKKMNKPGREKPQIDIPKANIALNRGGMGLIEIGVVPHKGISGTMRDFAYNPDEVDQPPSYLRTYQPQYPYLAKRDNIEGRVRLRFVVDLDGQAKEAEVVKAEPAGFFEEAALKAIERYKFKPAIKDGNVVICNAALTISFVLD